MGLSDVLAQLKRAEVKTDEPPRTESPARAFVDIVPTPQIVRTTANASREDLRGRPSLLSPTVEADIIAAIEEGSYAWVACQSAGISKESYHRWMRGETPETLAFRDRVLEAHARARKKAETRVFHEDPVVWLRQGPGRDRGFEEPGWTEAAPRVRVDHTVNGRVAHAHLHAAAPMAPSSTSDAPADTLDAIDVDAPTLTLEDLDAFARLAAKAEHARERDPSRAPALPAADPSEQG